MEIGFWTWRHRTAYKLLTWQSRKTGDSSPRNVVSGSNPLSTHTIVTSFIELQTGDGVEQAYFQSERAANSHAHTENIRLKMRAWKVRFWDLSFEVRQSRQPAGWHRTVRVCATPSIFTNLISSRKIRCGKSSSRRLHFSAGVPLGVRSWPE